VRKSPRVERDFTCWVDLPGCVSAQAFPSPGSRLPQTWHVVVSGEGVGTHKNRRQPRLARSIRPLTPGEFRLGRTPMRCHGVWRVTVRRESPARPSFSGVRLAKTNPPQHDGPRPRRGAAAETKCPVSCCIIPPFRSRTTGQMGDWSLSHSTGRRRCPGCSDRSPSGCPDLVANDLRQTNGTSRRAAGLWRSANGTGPSAVGGGWPAVGSRETALTRIHTSLLPLPRVACEAGMRPLPSSVASG
jgi:hypothetical protein